MDIKELLIAQKQAIKNHNNDELTEVNKKIFAIREQEQRQKEIKREQQREARIAHRIERTCENER